MREKRLLERLRAIEADPDWRGIVSMRKYTPMTFLPDNTLSHDMEEVAMTYSKITWTFNDGNIEYTDDWKK